MISFYLFIVRLVYTELLNFKNSLNFSARSSIHPLILQKAFIIKHYEPEVIFQVIVIIRLVIEVIAGYMIPLN